LSLIFDEKNQLENCEKIRIRILDEGKGGEGGNESAINQKMSFARIVIIVGHKNFEVIESSRQGKTSNKKLGKSKGLVLKIFKNIVFVDLFLQNTFR
jgi:hypothetical protein